KLYVRLLPDKAPPCNAAEFVRLAISHGSPLAIRNPHRAQHLPDQREPNGTSLLSPLPKRHFYVIRLGLELLATTPCRSKSLHEPFKDHLFHLAIAQPASPKTSCPLLLLLRCTEQSQNSIQIALIRI